MLTLCAERQNVFSPPIIMGSELENVSSAKHKQFRIPCMGRAPSSRSNIKMPALTAMEASEPSIQ